VIALSAYLYYLNHLINARFEGGTWEIPSRVYARPLEIYPGAKLDIDSLVYELELSVYRSVASTPEIGQYRISGNSIELHSRSFKFGGRLEPGRFIRVEFGASRVYRLIDLNNSAQLNLVRLPPAIIGSYHPGSGEDRSLLGAEDIPAELVDILLAVEDRQFYHHFGVNPISIGRAFLANLKAGRTVQGGSTLTQQLAKNLFLTSERTLLRKVNEAFMALILEIRFSKETILIGYLNEVFLLQQNKISIHGFSLASRMLFKQTVDQLSTDKLALLVGMVKGPTRYNPINNPESARQRRNLVLRVMLDNGLINQVDYQVLIKKPLGTVNRLPGVNPFPAYLDLVKRQLRVNYSSSELSARGLQIFTPFDPLVQRELEQGLKAGLSRFNQHELQSAVIMTDYLNGDIQALVGDRQVDFPGFNRAVMAQRQIGSLIKPLLLYSLLYKGEYSLATVVEDKPIRIKQSDGKIWEPRNYDRKLRGEMTLYQAFVNSYNLPFVNLGVNGGLESLALNLEKIRLLKHETIYPSLLLGTTAMSVFEVAQMYQVIANNGYFTPLTSIRRVTDAENRELKSNPIDSVKLFDESTMLQVQRAMVGVAEEGTAKYLNNRFPGLTLAGKTGTTNDARDSWFAGYSDQLLSVVWLGRDDNNPINLTGSSGALRVWADIMERRGIKAFKITRDEALEWRYIDRFNGRITRDGCTHSVLLPFTQKQLPSQRGNCS
ncbi:MAG: penicillin-binding protein 1B, partial [Gammaproteobacteria bacterium]|nr:penicillin-binding protein 1B [Gammaproteobacteria bacterium]